MTIRVSVPEKVYEILTLSPLFRLKRVGNSDVAMGNRAAVSGHLQPPVETRKRSLERPQSDRHQTVARRLLYVNLFRDFQCIVNFDAKVAHRAIEL